ncbi:MurR/RpiR family transcriptional regulator [bacterium 1XD8-76]|nr:MurR/RpiR family transcriptional regulator [bacterium 1XD8-76]
MLLEKLEQGMNFTNHEKDVARYILEHPDKAPGMSSAELAEASFTSKATVVRLCQKLGLTGYQEFRLKLVEEIGQKNRLARMLAGEPIHDKSTCTDIINTLPGLYDKAVTNTRLALDKNSINRIHNVLRRAECVDIYGTGISYILAQAAAFKFATLGVESSAYESINGHYLAARKNRRTIAFLLSFTGANRTMIRTARYLRRATNNYVVGIMGPHNGVIRKECHEIVEIPNRDSLVSLDVITSFAAANYVIDILFSLLLSGCCNEHAKSSLEMLQHMDLLLDRAGAE